MLSSSSFTTRLIMGLVLFLQALTIMGVGTVAIIQPTPEMVQNATQQAGLDDWIGDAVVTLTQYAQPLFGRPKSVYAQSTVPAVVNGSPDNISFGSVSVGSTSVTQTVTIANIANPGSTISGGGFTTCAVTSDGGVKCWGWNGFGQLGDGTHINRTAPTDVIGLQTGVVSVQNSYHHTCALTANGGVKCWGYNGLGQLGDGSTTSRSTPVDVKGLTSGVLAIAVGQHHTCALTNQGSVMCWGYNGLGQLGDADHSNSNIPVMVNGLTTGAAAITAGEYFSCALTTSGGVKCWGYGGEGQLGNGANFIQRTPVDVSGLTSGIKAIGAGQTWACAVTTDGAAKCWGHNGQGQLGNGSYTSSNVPVNVSSLSSGVTTIEGGLHHTCALTASGGVKCWGYNAEGQLGDGGHTMRNVPADVTGLTSGVRAIGAGYYHSCAITSDGSAKCWGHDGLGQLGDGFYLNRSTPVAVNGQPVLFATSSLQAASAGGLNSCAVTADGGVKCWGYNDYGQLGDGNYTSRSEGPRDVVGLSSGVTAVANNYFHTCALTSSGGVKCWGYNGYGQLGYSTSPDYRTNVPGNVTGLTSGVTAVATGEQFSCALTSSGGVKCWGYGGHGQLGNGSTHSSNTPVDVIGLTSGVSAIGVGNYHACAALTAGGVKCWGWNAYGQLGNGSNNGVNSTPVTVSGLSGTVVTALTGDLEHTCALTSSGGVKCWGDNGNGQLGDGSTSHRNTPVDVSGLISGVVAIDTGYHHTCALTSSGGVKCWGYNGSGQVGDNTHNQRTTPVNVNGLTSGATSLAVGRYHSCAILDTGDMKCWGYDGLGQLGDGANNARYKPATVSTLISGLPDPVDDLSVTEISLSGVDASDFSVVGGSCGNTFPITLTQGANCTVLLKANPSSTGTSEANLTINSSDSAQSIINVPLDVTTADPDIDVSPESLNFGNVNLGVTSPAQLVTIRNVAPAGGVMRSGPTSAHTCAVTDIGGVKCWGYNNVGQLGDGTQVSHYAPVDVTGLITGVKSLATGDSHTCALTNEGGVKCWGYNNQGQLGYSTTPSSFSAVPQDVPGLTSGVNAIAAGAAYSCALLNNGGLKCWGYNNVGQLGNGSTTSNNAPVDVSGLTSGVSAIAAAENHTCAILSDGGMKCWGYNNVGQLGYSTSPSSFSTVPQSVTNLTSGVRTMALGRLHSCAVTESGGAKCWGYNNLGQLGDGTTTNRATPTDVSSLTSGVAALAAGEEFTCALLSSGGAKCWGYNGQGQLGDGGTTTRGTPADVLGLTKDVDSITAGQDHACVTTSNGGGTCWGYNNVGQLGNGTTRQSPDPTAVVGQPYLFATAANAAAAGGYGSCAVTANKGAKCWGNDEYWHVGVGDGNSDTRYGPVDVSGLLSGTAQLATTRYHACAVLTDGSLKCWGLNNNGQLGDGSTTNRQTPTDVSGFGSGSGGSITNLSAGYQSSCALTSAGGIKCWGWNGYGQLGEGSTNNRYAPTAVTGITSGATAVENGTYHSCAIVNGGVKCWGYNGEGQLGDSTNSQRTTPVDVTGLGSGSGVTAIATGHRHTCAITSSGAVKCWGWNGNGQLGDGTTLNSNTPVDVSGLSSGVTKLAVTEHSTCALLSSGAVKCWGYNGEGQLGNGSTTQSTTPVNVSSLSSGVTAIEGGEYQSFCALTSSGGMKCWGYNGYGQLGDGSTTRRLVPTDVSGLTSGVTAMKAGRIHTCAIVNGGMKCWGYNGYGQLGDGTTTQRLVPTDVSGLSSGVTKMAAGEYYSCALVNGVSKCWGYNGNGQLGDGSTNQHVIPTDVAIAVSGVAFVATSQQHTCALTTDGAVKCWGSNAYGQVGDGTTTQRNAPVQVSGLTSNTIAIAVGENFSCALLNTGNVKCWGRNSEGRLGDGTVTNRTTPVDVSGLTSGVSAIGAGDAHACAALTSGGVKCWGYNDQGQLGSGNTTLSYVPVDASGLSSTVVTSLRGGYRHTCALTSDGGMKCWGYNNNGQLGNGNTTRSLVPIDVNGLTSGVTSIAVGSEHSCAILDTGHMKCWGYNGYGQAGDGTNNNRTTPNEVATLLTGVAGSIGALNVTDIALNGGDSGQFAIASGGSCSNSFPFSLSSGASCTVPVTFGPTSYGTKNANLMVSSNDPLSPTVAVSLTGVAVGPDLQILTSGPDNAVQGTDYSYTLVVTNTGNSDTSGTITVSDTLPSGLTFVSGSGSGFTCSASGQDITCARSTSIAVSGTATINLSVTPTELGTMVNSADVIGAGDLTAQTSDSTNTTVGAPPPDLTMVIGQVTPDFVATISSTIPITVSNSGSGATSGVISATLELPLGTTAPITFTDGTWSCSTDSQTVTCLQPNLLLPGESSTVNVPVTPDASTVGTQPTFNGAVFVPVETVTGNNTASPMTPTVPVAPAPAPDLVISMSGPITATENADFDYTLTITNTGTVSTSGVITVTDVLSTGLSFVSGSGSGFSCSANAQTVTCTSSTALAVNASTTITIAVHPTAPGVKTNSASVIGGGDDSVASSNAVATTVSAADTTAPTTTVTSPVTGTVTNDTTPTISGTGEPASTVTVTVGSQTMTTTVPASGNWTVTPTASIGSDGLYTPTVSAVDGAGNSYGPANGNPFTLDTVLAAPTVTAPTANAILSDTTPTISGTGEPGSTVTVTVGSQTMTASVPANGNWTVTPTASIGSDGVYTPNVTSSDAAGNVSGPVNGNPFTLDTTAPSAPVVTSPISGTTTADNTPTIAGTAEPTSTVTVKDGSGNTVCTTTADASGNWSCDTTTLPNGADNLSVTATDAAGNISPATPFLINVNSTTPTSPVVTAPVSGTVTSDATPTITGTAQSGVTVTVKNGSGSTLCTTTADASGNWNCTTSTLPEGSNPLSVIATNNAGTDSPATPHLLVVDTTAPSAPVLNAVTASGVTTDTTPTLSGTAEPNAVVTVKEGSTTLCTTTADASGNWSCDPSTPLSEGPHTIGATATDSAGNTSPAATPATITVDTTAPSAPTVSSPTASSVLSDTTPTLTGTAEPTSTVTVKDGSGNTVCTATTNASGNWSCTTSVLPEGLNNLGVTATDPAGNTSPATSLPLTIDTTAPTAPVVTSPISGTTTADNTPTIMGTAEPTSTVTVKDGSGNTVCTATTNASGNWNCDTTTLSNGANDLSVTATDAAGNTSPATPFPINVNSTTPTSPIVTAPVSGTVTNDATPTITGTAQAGVTVTVKNAGGSTLCTTTADGSGNWSCTTSTLPEGSNPLSVIATNNAGTDSPATAHGIVVDTTAPTAPVLNVVTASGITTDTTPTISGTAEPSTTVTVKEGSTTLCTATADASGNWSCDPSTPLSEGTHAISATATDGAGNSSPAATPATITVDTTAPSAPVVTTPISGTITADNTPTISGTAEPTSTVTVKDGSGNTVCTTAADASGNWSCDTTTLPNGANNLSVTATDAAGNISPATPFLINVNSTTPTSPVVTAPVSGTVTSDSTPTITGTAQSGVTVTVKNAGGSTLCTTTADASGNWNCTTSTLSEGSNPLSVIATNNAGTDSPATPHLLIVDTTAPSAPTVTSPTAGSPISDTTPTITGTAEPTSTVTVKDGSGNTVCTTTTNASGNWSCTTSTLPEGLNNLGVTATDPAGNTSPATSLPLTIDTTAPSAPTVTSPTAGSVLSDTTPTLTGTAEPTSTVTVKDGSGNTVCTTTANASGNWSCTTSVLPEGLNNLGVTATDPAGNTSPATSLPLTIDTTAPSAPVVTSPISGTITADNTPTISGTAEPTSTVTVKDGSGNTVCTATTNASGNWSCDTTTLPNGADNLSVTATDAAGNISPATPHLLNVNSTTPTSPIVTAPVSGTVTSDATPTITGTAQSGVTVTVKNGSGSTLCTTTADASGNWNCTTSTLPEGSNPLSVIATNNAGTDSPATPHLLVVDTTAPSAPVLNAVTASGVTTDTTPTLSGTAEPNAVVTVKEGSTTLCTTTADASGNWSCDPSTPLSEGPHTIGATATDSAGNTSPAATPTTISVDTTAPAAPVVTSPTAGSPISDTTPTITGTAEPTSTVTVKDGSGNTVCTTTANASGNWSCTTSVLPEGLNNLGVTATDPAGNTSPATSLPLTIDTTAPSAPTVTSPTAGSVLSDTTPTITGTAEPTSTVTVKDGSGNTVCTTTANASGNWSCTTSTLPEGLNNLGVTASDPAGNTSPATSLPLTIDTTAPSAPTVTSPTAGSVLSDTTPTISGTAEPTSTVKVKDGSDNTVCTTTTNASGNWSCTTSALPTGLNNLGVTATDPAGNTSSPTALPLTVDTTAPSAPTVTSPTAGSVLSDTTPAISGTAEPTSTVTVKDVAGNTVCTATTNASGNWSCTTSVLPEGLNNLGVTASDPAGNTSPATSLPLTIDTTAPSAPTVTSPTAGSVLSDTTPTISGTSEPTSTVTVKDGSGNTVCTTTANASGNWSCTTSALPTGLNNLGVTATDPAGNTSPTTSLPLTIDTTAPAAPTVTTPISGTSTADNTPTISGSAEANSTVTVKDSSGSVLCTTTANASGLWSCTSSTLPDGTNALAIAATDSAGNSSPALPLIVNVDTSVPVTPTIVSLAANSSTNDATPIITGTAEAGSTVVVKEGSTTLCSAVTASNGNWQCAASNPLSSGSHIIAATSSDAAGNSSTSPAIAFTVDAIAPAAPTILVPGNNQSIGDSTPTITGTAEAGSTVVVKEGATTLCSALVDATGSWNCTPTTALAEGPHTITATATDPAGNSSSPAARNFSTDTLSPTAPTVTAPISGTTTNDNTPILAGTAEAGNSVVVKEGSTTLCITTADGSGRWQCAPASTLSDGTHTVQVTATDSAGNVSPATTDRFSIDTSAPAQPTIVAPAASSITSDTTPLITGTAEAAVTVTVKEGGNTLCTVVADSAGQWSCTPATALSNGGHTILATASDIAGNSSLAAATNFMVDSVAPVAPTITQPATTTPTRDNTPAISGTAEPGATVNVSTSPAGTLLCSATADGVGNWSCSPLSALPDGTSAVVAAATDAAGNSSPLSAPHNVVIDTTAPAAPLITAPVEGSTTASSTPIVKGTAEAGSTVTLSEGGTTLCSAVADVTGAWQCTTSALSNGNHTVAAVATDPAGNTSPVDTQSFTVDAPSTPAILSPSASQLVSDTTPAISGLGTPSGTVTVKEGSVTLCTTTVDTLGNWSCSPATPLSEGSHTILATVADSGGSVVTSPNRTFTVDSQSPAAPMISAPVPNSSTADSTPTVSGTAEPGSTVTVSDNGTPICSAVANALGQWSCTPTTTLADGPHNLAATASDPAGNRGPASATVPVTVDTVAPTAPVVTAPAPSAILSDTTPTLTGTTEPSSTVSVKENGTTLCSAVANALGNWSCTPAVPLSDGTHILAVNATDPTGNSSPATSLPITVDSHQPTAPAILAPTANSTISVTTPIISGVAEANATVQVSENGVPICVATVNSVGNWSCVPSSPLSEGAHTISALAIDSAGNASLPANRSFTVDSTAPSAPVIHLPTAASTVNDSTPAISGTAEPGSTVAVKDGTTTLCTAVADGAGNWSCTPSTPLSNGPHNLTATASDPVGNSSTPSSADPITVDTIAPVAPAIGNPTQGSNLSDNTPTISGSAEPTSTVTVPENGLTLCSANSDASGHWSCTPALPLINGSHTIMASATDAAGNSSAATPRTFTINDTTPAISSPGSGSTISDTTPTVAGVGIPGGLVTVTQQPSGTVLCTATVDPLGNWSCTATTPLDDGERTLQATISDPSGAQTTEPISFTVDGSAPAAPVILAPAANATLADNTPLLSGTAEANSQVTVKENGATLCTTTADSTGNWSCVPATPLAEGLHSIVATALDAAGNLSPASSESFTVDTLDPSTPTITSPAMGSSTGDNTPTVHGTGQPGTTVTVSEDGTPICSAQVDVSGNWNCVPATPLDDGAHTWVAVASDDAGNSSMPAVTTVALDTSAPTAPAISQPVSGTHTSSTSPLVVGTAEPGALVKVMKEATLLCTATANATGQWNCAPVTPLPAGEHTISAIATDAASNQSLTTTTLTFTIETIPAGDSDGDGLSNSVECPGVVNCPDSDRDGQPDYLDVDSDNDGIPDSSEGTQDSDSDGIPNRLEDNAADSDGDGILNPLDADDDGDGIPTKNEDLNGDNNWFNDDKDGDGIPAYLDPNDAQPSAGDADGDGINDASECPSNSACPDTDGDGVPDYMDADSDGDGVSDASEGVSDSDGDGIPNRLEANNVDTDGDGLSNQNDNDDDGDGIPTASEDLNHDGNFVNDDADGDGIPAYLDPNDAQPGFGDSDEDGIDDKHECPSGNACPDSDGDGTPDYLDVDSDNDGIPDSVEGNNDSDGDGLPNRLEANNVDTDGDGLSNQNDADDDGDGIPTAREELNGDGNFVNDDQDGDGIPAYLDPNDASNLSNGGDSDGDGIADRAECPSGNRCLDSDGDGSPDYLDKDADNDGILDSVEGTLDSDGDGIPNRLEANTLDTDGDGKPNQMDSDDDGDGIPTASEDLNQDKNWTNDDQDGDGIPAYLDPNDTEQLANGGDSDNDGISDASECPTGPACSDTDGDGTPDYADTDSDGDGNPDTNEGSTDSDNDGIPNRLEPNNVDSDGDGLSDQNDADDDGDGILTANEDLNGDGNLANDDRDGDGIPAYLDPNDATKLANGGDSDGDGISDAAECPSAAPCADTDGDGQPDYLDGDSDNDGLLDSAEGSADSDQDGLPNRLEPNNVDSDGDGLNNQNDADDDGDGIPTASEDLNGDHNFANDDKDGDSIPAYLDPNDGSTLANGGDSDGDGINDAEECPNGIPCADSDGDGQPDYLDKDSDNDGLLDSAEGNSDSDGDGIANRLEANNVDSDGDGLSNQNDADDDGDGIPTASEDLNDDGNLANDDKDGDGIPAYLDPNDGENLVNGGDSDGDGITDAAECVGGKPCADSDGDGQPDYLDKDADGDGLLDSAEGNSDSDGDGVPNRLEAANQDTDGDGLSNQNDPDDDGDGTATAQEDLNGDHNFANDDKDGDGIPAYLDPNDASGLSHGGDSDGDGINDASECPQGAPCPDTDGDGRPDYLDKDSDNDGLLDSAEGSSDSDGDGIPNRLEANNADTDGDGLSDQNDADDDGDGTPTADEDLNGDGNLANDDQDRDGIPAYLDPNDASTLANGGDSDDDGIDDAAECPSGSPCLDSDGDGTPDYLDTDSDGDGILDAVEGDNDSDSDGVPNRLEANNLDTDGDGLPNQNDADDDGDSIPTLEEDLNGDGNFVNDDKDGDGIPAYLDPNDAGNLLHGGDSDSDGINDATECPSGTPCPDTDGDGTPDYLDKDSDGDGIPDSSEGANDSDNDGVPNRLESALVDSDGDGIPNQNDADDDGDGIPTKSEDLNHDGNFADDDKDSDGIPAYLDPNDANDLANGGDSDGDGIEDASECPQGEPCPDSDGDGIPDYTDKDSDGDGLLDSVEGSADTDKDGIPNRLEPVDLDTDGDGKPNQNDADDDGDGILTANEDLNGDGNLANDDKDGDGIPAYLDPNDAANLASGGDSDGDGIADAIECPNGTPCPDTNGDGQPDYLDTDSDGDGVPDASEGSIDSDGDGIPNRLEAKDADTDGDGIPNQEDKDDDGDGIPTKDEDLNGDGDFANDDKDGDGIPAYLDPNDAGKLVNGGDSDGDGINDLIECAGGVPCPDTDRDGTPDYADRDADGDGVLDKDEGTLDSDGDGIPNRLEPNNLDTDGDGKSNQLDPNDDGDATPTKDEDLNHDGNLVNDDTDGDGIPDYLDPDSAAREPSGGDSDHDGIADGLECPSGMPCLDSDQDGRPDYMDIDSDNDGLTDIQEGTGDSDNDGIPNYRDAEVITFGVYLPIMKYQSGPPDRSEEMSVRYYMPFVVQQ